MSIHAISRSIIFTSIPRRYLTLALFPRSVLLFGHSVPGTWRPHQEVRVEGKRPSRAWKRGSCITLTGCLDRMSDQQVTTDVREDSHDSCLTPESVKTTLEEGELIDSDSSPLKTSGHKHKSDERIRSRHKRKRNRKRRKIDKEDITEISVQTVEDKESSISKHSYNKSHKRRNKKRKHSDTTDSKKTNHVKSIYSKDKSYDHGLDESEEYPLKRQKHQRKRRSSRKRSRHSRRNSSCQSAGQCDERADTQNINRESKWFERCTLVTKTEENSLKINQNCSKEYRSLTKDTVVYFRDEPYPIDVDSIPLPDAIVNVKKVKSSANYKNSPSQSSEFTMNNQWLTALQSSARMYAHSHNPAGSSSFHSNQQQFWQFLPHNNNSVGGGIHPTLQMYPNTWANHLFPHQPSMQLTVLPTQSLHHQGQWRLPSGPHHAAPDRSMSSLMISLPEASHPPQSSSPSQGTASPIPDNWSFPSLRTASPIPDNWSLRNKSDQPPTVSQSKPLGFKSSQTSERTAHSYDACRGAQDRKKNETVLCAEITDSKRQWQPVGPQSTDTGSTSTFTVMSYNILAQDLMEDHPDLYTGCDSLKAWDFRGPALCRQILAHGADIVCLQEVQENHWMFKLKPIFQGAGYGCRYKRRTGDKWDGCAILYKEAKFQLERTVPVEFAKGGVLDRDNVGLILLLKTRPELYPRGSQRLCVATTHLLFNPKRGDVKLAQLMLFLAELDKLAYKGQQKSCESLGQSDNNSKVDNEPKEQMKFRQSPGQSPNLEEYNGTKGASPPSSGRSSGCDKQSVKTKSLVPVYHPTILCGDFNSEPGSPLLDFITKGALDYKNVLCRLLSGQEEGKHWGRNNLVPKYLLPTRLQITECCQYQHQARKRDSGKKDSSSSSGNINTGLAMHKMNFHSAYSTQPGRSGRSPRVVTTQHSRASCMVDYIFYSSSCNSSTTPTTPKGKRRESFSDNQKAREKQRGTPDITEGVSSIKNGSDMDLSDSDGSFGESVQDMPQQSSNVKVVDQVKVSDGEGPLVLLSQYTLPTDRELKEVGPMPNKVFPSDHVCLLVKFLLK